MANELRGRNARRLQEQLANFLNSSGPRSVVKSTLSEWQQKNWQPYLFGGILRDLLVLGLKANPRDIDVVVSNGTSEELEESLQPYVRRRNRFGGFQIERSRWQFDVWPLKATWAFTQDESLAAVPENLPKTTFLNVEAIAISIVENGRLGNVFESGFFDAVETQTLDINFEHNPYPALAAVRAIATALKLRYSISPRLGLYIINTAQRMGLESLVAAQDLHYGFVRLRNLELGSITAHIQRELDSNPVSPISIPGSVFRQLSLWDHGMHNQPHGHDSY